MLTSFSVFTDWSGYWEGKVRELEISDVVVTEEASAAATEGEQAVGGALIGVDTVGGC